jgi:hypothetical protein
VRVPAAQRQGDELNARFHQSGSEQTALTECLVGKLLRKCRRFLADIERFARSLGSNNGVRLLTKAIKKPLKN